jgi:thiamine-phosphate pyrophosphorylase
MRGLYPIIDVDALAALHLPLLDFAERVLSVGPALLQLRAKHLAARDTLELLRALKPLCDARGAALFANDRPDLALIAGCAGVHVGQDDLSPAEVRQIAPGLRIGVSTHDLEQLREALVHKPAYVAFGPVFATTSKERPDALVGLDGLESAAELSRGAAVPLVAIGGIGIDSAKAVAAHAACGAVISGLLPTDGDSEGVAGQAAALHAALSGRS